MSRLFSLTIACIVGFIAAGPINGPCCLKKTVGNVSYTHVEQTDTSGYACLSNCVYEQDGVLGSRFCFAHGELPVICNGISDDLFCRDGETWKDDEDLLDRLKTYPGFPDSLEKHFMCCKGDPCLIGNCSSICGPGDQLECVLDVGHPELEEKKKYCEDDGRTFDAVWSSSLRDYFAETFTQTTCITKKNEKNKQSCPQKMSDNICICCKWPDYVKNVQFCSTPCVCNGLCEWAHSRGYYSPGCCDLCSTACKNIYSTPIPTTSSPNDLITDNSEESFSNSSISTSSNPNDVRPFCQSLHCVSGGSCYCPDAVAVCCEALEKDSKFVTTYCPQIC